MIGIVVRFLVLDLRHTFRSHFVLHIVAGIGGKHRLSLVCGCEPLRLVAHQKLQELLIPFAIFIEVVHSVLDVLAEVL